MRIFILALMLLTILTAGCAQKYTVMISDVDFTHEGGFDRISYTAYNPVAYDLSCDLVIDMKKGTVVKETFEIKAEETKTLFSVAKFPEGQTDVSFITDCRKVIQ